MRQTGDHGPLLEKYRPYLRMLARAKLGARMQSRIDASDLTQETLLQACKNLSQLDDHEKLQGWLKSILENVTNEALRKNKAGMRSLDREEPLPNLDDSCRRLEEWLAASGLGPEGQADRNEQLLELALALESLPAKQRAAIELRFLHGKAVKEVAQELATTPPAVAGLLRRGVDALRECMGCEGHAKPREKRGTS